MAAFGARYPIKTAVTKCRVAFGLLATASRKSSNLFQNHVTFLLSILVEIFTFFRHVEKLAIFIIHL